MQYVTVPGARRIWGTLPATNSRAVEQVISSLTYVSAGELRIKRKYKTAPDNSNSCTQQRVVRWWFVVRGEDSVLEQLQKDWHLVAIHTDWKLTPLLQYAKPNVQLQNQRTMQTLSLALETHLPQTH